MISSDGLNFLHDIIFQADIRLGCDICILKTEPCSLTMFLLVWEFGALILYRIKQINLPKLKIKRFPLWLTLFLPFNKRNTLSYFKQCCSIWTSCLSKCEVYISLEGLWSPDQLVKETWLFYLARIHIIVHVQKERGVLWTERLNILNLEFQTKFITNIGVGRPSLWLPYLPALTR